METLKVIKIGGNIIDDERWVIPASVAKNRKAHKIPLTPTLKRHLKAIWKLSGDTPYLFPQSRYEDNELIISDDTKPVATSTVSKAIKANLGDKLTLNLCLKKFT